MTSRLTASDQKLAVVAIHA